MTQFRISNIERNVTLEFEESIIVDSIEIALYRNKETAKHLIEIYENLKGEKYNPKRNGKKKPLVRKC